MANIIGTIEREILLKALWFKGKAAVEKYYIYLQNIRQDYRWLMMFIIARFPFGRWLGTFFYRDRQIEQKSHCHTVKQETYPITTLDKINQLKSIFRDVDSAIAVESIKEHGYYLGLQLPNFILKDILEYAYTANISIDGNQGFNFKYSAKD